MNSASMATAEPQASAVVQPRTPHLTEYFGVTGFFVLCAMLSHRVWLALGPSSAVGVLAACLLGYVASDLTSGMVHWAFDTWGSPDTPVLGKNFIIPFRVHHSDPKDITVHGFIATNGHNCLVSLPVLGLAFLVSPGWAWGPAVLTFIVSLCLGVFATNQFHKWAHADEVSPAIRLLQRSHLILGPEHHSVHHAAPYEHNYCITSGWLNTPLRALGFFRRLERTITQVTGIQPRKDDLKGQPEPQR